MFPSCMEFGDKLAQKSNNFAWETQMQNARHPGEKPPGVKLDRPAFASITNRCLGIKPVATKTGKINGVGPLLSEFLGNSEANRILKEHLLLGGELKVAPMRDGELAVYVVMETEGDPVQLFNGRCIDGKETHSIFKPPGLTVAGERAPVMKQVNKRD